MRRSAVAMNIVGLALLAACGASDGVGQREGVLVVASFFAVAEAAELVGGGLVAVQNMTPAGVEPHDLELAPDDLEAIVTADVVLYLGGGFQPAIEEAVADAEGVAVDVLDAAGPLRPQEGTHDDQGGEGELSTDPHVWLDPARYAEVVDAVGEALAEADPSHADAFRSGAEAFGSELSTLDAEFSDGLETCRSRTMVVNHDAFGYMADAYGLEQHAISGVSPEAEPNPARLAELRDLVEAEGITTIFTEELASPEVAQTLADEAGVSVEVLSPLEGLTPEEVEAGEGYLSIMRRNLETLRAGLGCA